MSLPQWQGNVLPRSAPQRFRAGLRGMSFLGLHELQIDKFW